MLRAYGRVAIKAHERTNCITEFLFPEAVSWMDHEVNLEGPLAGIPVSVKDSVRIKGFDSTLGYSAWAGKPAEEDGALIKLLKDAGMLTRKPFVKETESLMRLQGPSRMQRPLCPSHFCLLSRLMGFGATASIRMSPNTRPVAPQGVKLLYWHWVVE